MVVIVCAEGGEVWVLFFCLFVFGRSKQFIKASLFNQETQ